MPASALIALIVSVSCLLGFVGWLVAKSARHSAELEAKARLPRAGECWLLHGHGSIEVQRVDGSRVFWRGERERELYVMTIEQFIARAHHPRRIALVLGVGRRET